MKRPLLTNEGYDLRANHRRIVFHLLESCTDFIDAFYEHPEIYTTLSHCYEMKMESDELDWDEGWYWAQNNDTFAFKYLKKHLRTTKWECLWEPIVDAWTEWRAKIYEKHYGDMVEALACMILLNQYEMEYVEEAKMWNLLEVANQDWDMDDWKQGIERLIFGGASHD